MLFHRRIPFMQSALKNWGIRRYCLSLSNTDSIPKIPQIDRYLSKLSNLGELETSSLLRFDCQFIPAWDSPTTFSVPTWVRRKRMCDEGGGDAWMCMQVPAEARRWYQVPWSWTYRQLWTSLCGNWELNSGPSTRTASASNPGVIVPVSYV